jgi:hypothetical protein
MKIKKIALTAIVPVAVAGTTLTSWAAVKATSDHHADRTPHHLVVHARHHQDAAHEMAAHQPAAKHRPRAAHLTHTQATHRSVIVTAKSHPVKRAASPAATTDSLNGGMSSFEHCVAWRESGDNPTASSSGLFGILPATWASLGLPGTAGQASVAEQKAAFARLYAAYGTQPWSSYDGC